MTDPVDPFRTRSHVPDFDAIAAAYAARSEAPRERLRHRLDIAYGPAPAERLDLYFPDDRTPPAPIHIFIHGGYWRANARTNYGFLAEPVVASGGICAVIDYTLMPHVRMATLVDEVRRAASWLAANAASFGGNPAAISASGQSAGAHLALYLAARGPHESALPATPVQALLMVSGIYDLAPIPGSFLQPEIGLTPEEVERWSPVSATHAPGVARAFAVGANETAPFHAQQARLAEILAAAGSPAETHTLPGLNHMSILLDMGTPGTALGKLLAATVDQSRR